MPTIVSGAVIVGLQVTLSIGHANDGRIAELLTASRCCGVPSISTMVMLLKMGI